jgi:PTS system nitrogen regulatory IIA component
MQVVDILSPARIVVSKDGGDEIHTRSEVLHRLAELLAAGDARLDAATVESILTRREDQQSTGVGGGVAIPHAAVEDIDQIVGALLLCPEPVGFGAIDGMPVSIFFAVIGPRRAVGEHLKTLARVSRLVRDDGFRQRLVGAEDGRAAFELIATEEGRPA